MTTAAVLVLTAGGGAMAATGSAPPSAPIANAASYRHGVVPTLGHQAMGSAATAASSSGLSYHGGIDGIGVTTGPEKVYLVLYGSQWGSQSTDAKGDATFSGDPKGAVPYLQEFFKGLGSSTDSWSGVMTQYCDGVATGATSCPAANSQHVAYPYGGALAGVWEDSSAASPASATKTQLAAEAVAAAAHFGNTTAAANRNAQYVIISPTGANPDGFRNGVFCAWHGDNKGNGVASPYGDIALTNLPYLTDVGTFCGMDYVNAGGTLDGFTIVEGHEYAETITDQNPFGGWANSSGKENGDLCAWISSGQGATQNITLSTGTFPVQSTWANDFNGGAGGCEISHPIVSDPAGGTGNTVTVTGPGNQTGTVGTAASVQISASDSATGQRLTFTAGGLPAGLSISNSGLISGTPATAGTSTVTVTATDATGAAGTATFTWTVNPSGGGTCTAPAWNSSVAYNGGAVVSYNGHRWTAKWWTFNNAPGTSGGAVWTDGGPC